MNLPSFRVLIFLDKYFTYVIFLQRCSRLPCKLSHRIQSQSVLGNSSFQHNQEKTGEQKCSKQSKVHLKDKSKYYLKWFAGGNAYF